MRIGKSLIAVLAMGVITGVAPIALAVHHVGGGSNNKSGNPDNSNNSKNNNNSSAASTPTPKTTPPASQPSKNSQDQAAQTAAAAELVKDEQALKDVSDADWATFQQKPEWTAAAAKIQSAQTDLDTAKKTATDALASNPDYQSAQAAKKKAVDDLEAAKAGGDATPETLAPLANASLQAGLKMRKMESEVYTNDPSVQTATESLASAQHDADLLKMKFQQGLFADKQYAAAKAVVDAAQKRYDDAHAKLLADSGSSSGN